MDNKNIFAENLNRYMELHEKTRKEVSEAIGVSYFTFTDWVNGKKYPRMDKVEKLANYFGILKSDLIERPKPERIEMQKKNDVLSDVILKMNEDMELLSMVETLTNLGFEQRQAVKTMIDALSKVDK